MANGSRNTLAASLYYPWWDIRVTHQYERGDFIPRPSINSVLLQLTRRDAPLLPVRQNAACQNYSAYRFTRDPHASRVPARQFMCDFREFVRTANRQRLRSIDGAFGKLQEQQSQLQKIHRTRTDPRWKRSRP